MLNSIGNENICMITAKTNPFSRLKPESYSYTITNHNNYKENISQAKSIYVKSKPNVSSSIITGSFFSKNINSLLSKIESNYKKIPNVNGEKYLDSYCKYINDKGEIVNCISANIYQSLGTPIEYQTALYWNSFIKYFR